MKYLIPILLIISISSGNAEDEYIDVENIEVDKKICFEAFKKGKVVDKQIEVESDRRGIQMSRNTVTDIIYKNKYYTLSVLRYLWYDSNNQLPSSIKCRVYEETKKIKKKE